MHFEHRFYNFKLWIIFEIDCFSVNICLLKLNRSISEDFFKAAKESFGLGEFHSYTEKFMVKKNILLGLLLTTLVVPSGFKTKTQLQRLSESYIDFEPSKINKKKNELMANKAVPPSTKVTDKHQKGNLKFI